MTDSKFLPREEANKLSPVSLPSSLLRPHCIAKERFEREKGGEAEGGGSATSSFPCPLIEVSLESEEEAAAAAAAASLDINDHSLPTKPPEEAEERGS